MDSNRKVKRSVIAALITLGFFCGLFVVGMSDPAIYHAVIIAGIVVSSVMAFCFWRIERRTDTESSAIGVWIVAAICALCILLLLILPALG
jgi:hypothetical protein